MLCMKYTATERNEKIEFFEATWDFASETFTLPHKMPNERKEIHRMNKRTEQTKDEPHIERNHRRHVYSIQMNIKFAGLLLAASSLSLHHFASQTQLLSSHLMPLVHFIMRKEEIERVCTAIVPRCVIDNYNSKQQQQQKHPLPQQQ